ncbi:MAG: hypothetical protein GEV06_16590 [Luteitalea sp.]|nr:hypothetical protein [Luteitalea sp.]
MTIARTLFLWWCVFVFWVGWQTGTALSAEQEPTVGHGLLCDTIPQVERFVELSQEMGANPVTTVATINQEEENPTACAFAAVTFLPIGVVKHINYDHKAYLVIAVTVTGFAGPQGVQPTPPMEQFTVVQIEEMGA